jgi:tripartite-type tricarboxylate transporter receptor subunit TctC
VLDRRSLVHRAALAAAAIALPSAASRADGFPTRPVTMIVPWPAGGGTDIWHRALAEVMAKDLGQPVIVENKVGASGTLGPATMAATAKPDGYTICHIPVTVFRLPVTQKVSWDPLRDFTWIAHASGFEFATIVRKDARWASFQSLIDDARLRPTRITYATPGAGTSLHIGMELIARRAGIHWTHVPFRGMTEAIAALEGGHVDVLAGGADWWPMFEAGRMRPLVFWTEKRNPRTPDVPVLAELGFPFVLDSPFGFAGPRGMEASVVKRLHDAIHRALTDPGAIAVRQRFDLQDRYMDTAAYQAFAADLFAKEKTYLESIGLARKE